MLKRPTFRAAPGKPAEQRIAIRWDDLGCPTQPCTREYQGELVEVRERDIQAAHGNPSAIFTAYRFQLWGGPAYYRLGVTESPRSVATPQAPKPYEGARQLLIKWAELGSPSTPGTFEYRGTVVDVQYKNILAARGNPEAVFTATKIRPHAGRPYYVLGKAEIPEVIFPAKVA
jgi:hypothetical protein